MVAEREKAEREGRLPFTPPERAVAVAAAPEPRATRPTVVAGATQPRVLRQARPSEPTFDGSRVAANAPRSGGLEEMSIEDLISQNGG